MVYVVLGPIVLQLAGRALRAGGVVAFGDGVDVVGAVGFDIGVVCVALGETSRHCRWYLCLVRAEGFKGGNTDLLVDQDGSSRVRRYALRSQRRKMAGWVGTSCCLCGQDLVSCSWSQGNSLFYRP